jgi:hypothetical protein
MKSHLIIGQKEDTTTMRDYKFCELPVVNAKLQPANFIAVNYHPTTVI